MNKLTFKEYAIMFAVSVICFVGLGLFALHQWSTQGGI